MSWRASTRPDAPTLSVNDVLGNDGKWRNLASRQIADFVPPAGLERWLTGRKLDAVIHLGAIPRRPPRPTAMPSWRIISGCRFGCSTGAPRRARRSSMPLRPQPMATGEQGYSDDWSNGALKRLRPMNLYGWSKHLFDLAVVERVRRKDPLPPQWVGLEILQCLRPQRISQRRDDERRRQASSTRPRPASRSACSSRIVPAWPTASSSATSSMSTTRSRWCCWLLETAERLRHLQRRHRPGAAASAI